jgi:hypothetical protein
MGNGYEKPQLGALGFSRNPGRGHAVKNLAELKAEAVRYKLSLGWEVKTEIPAIYGPVANRDDACLSPTADHYPGGRKYLGVERCNA